MRIKFNTDPFKYFKYFKTAFSRSLVFEMIALIFWFKKEKRKKILIFKTKRQQNDNMVNNSLVNDTIHRQTDQPAHGSA